MYNEQEPKVDDGFVDDIPDDTPSKKPSRKTNGKLPAGRSNKMAQATAETGGELDIW
jgi:hypothetical protein